MSIASLTTGVGLSQYRGLTGYQFGVGLDFGVGQVTDDEIKKALSAGYQYPPTDGGNVLRVQSLEAVMRVTTFQQQHLIFFNMIAKTPAYNTVVEYNLLSNYGNTKAGSFLREGEPPLPQDSSYQRKLLTMKYCGTQREVTHQSTLVKTAHGNSVALETANGSVYLLHQIEMSLWRGRADIIPESYDGVERFIVSDPLARQKNIIDVRGGIIKPEYVENLAQIITQQWGSARTLFMAPKAHTDLSLQLYPLQRGLLSQEAQNNYLGASIDKIKTTNGEMPINSTVFLRSGDPGSNEKLAPSAATSPRAPNAPTLVLAVAAGISSQFQVGDLGTWRYKVTAINRFGMSGASAESTVVLAAAGDGVQITITDGGGADTATGYRIWRTKVVNDGANTEEEMVDVARVVGAATTVYVDANDDLPGTSKAFLLNLGMDIMGWHQLLPMLKINLATTAPTMRWMQLVYGTLAVYQPMKIGMIKNIKDN